VLNELIPASPGFSDSRFAAHAIYRRIYASAALLQKGVKIKDT